jgi:hypothetical protein
LSSEFSTIEMPPPFGGGFLNPISKHGEHGEPRVGHAGSIRAIAPVPEEV